MPDHAITKLLLLKLMILLLKKNADLVFISETWLRTYDDNITLANLLPNGFQVININRQSRTGGGVAIIYRSSIEILETVPLPEFSTFESCHLKIKTADSKSCYLSCIYRPTKSEKNNSSFSNFLIEFNEFLECLSN